VLLAGLFQKSLPFDPPNELRPLASVASISNFVLTNPGTPAKTFQEFVAYAKAHPGQLNAGLLPNTSFVIDYALFQEKTGIQLTMINYNGAAPMADALMRGDIQVFFGVPGSVLPLIKAGKVVPLAYAAAQRGWHSPEVPTTREVGADFSSGSDLGFWAPMKLPEELARRINTDVANAAVAPAVVARLRQIGFDPMPSREMSQQFPQKMQAYYKTYTETAKRIGIQPQ
jgi:tripartite-type tricarboxylate transporter receptor subunit TctC